MPVIPLHGAPIYQGEVLLLGWSENNRDGMTVRLALDATDEGTHPFKGLGTGKMGQRFMMVAVPLGDDDQPQIEAPAAPTPAAQAPAAEKPKRPWDELPYSQQAALLCNEIGFQRWIKVESKDAAAEFVRAHCGVRSRSGITEDSPAAREAWNRLVGRYRDFQRYGDMVA